MKTKYLIAFILTVLLLIPSLPSCSEENLAFRLDEQYILRGMDRSWLQGYEPSVSSGVFTLLLPVYSEEAEGDIQTEMLLSDISISPFKPQDMSVTTQRGRDGIYPVTLKLALYRDRKNGDYACTIRITGKSKEGEPLETDLPYTVRIRDGNPNTETARIQITDVQSEFMVGEDGYISAKLSNPCKTISFEQIVLRVSDSSGDIIPKAADVLYLPDLKPGESMDVSFPLSVLSKATVTPHSLKFDLSFSALGQSMSQNESFTCPVFQKVQLEPGAVQTEQIVKAGDKWTVSLPIMNPGIADVKSIMAVLSVPGLAEKQSVLLGTIAPGETKTAQFVLTIGKEKQGDYAGTIACNGADENGNQASFDVPVHLTVEKKANDIASLRMQISQVQGDLRVGEEGALTFTISNPENEMQFEYITLKISDNGNEVFPKDSDTVYIPILGPGENCQLTFPVTVLSKASVSPHSIKFDLNWFANGQNVTQSENYTVPVKQEIHLEQGGIKMASSVVAGDSITITVPLMNMGNADVMNTLATLSIPGIVEKQSVLVGTINPGDTKNAQITLTPSKDLAGEFDGTIAIETMDNDRNPASFSLPVHLTVEKPVKKETTVNQTDPIKEGTSLLTYALAGGCGVLLLILILQSILLRKKIHSLEEDRL